MAHRGHRDRGHRERESDDMNRSARCVFVGNIPYDATEEQLVEVFQQVGPVVSFRLVFDRETGKAKGYGFCEYRDSETALSAMRNYMQFLFISFLFYSRDEVSACSNRSYNQLYFMRSTAALQTGTSQSMFRITGDGYPSTSYLLNNYEFSGRNLRVDFAENEKANMQAAASGLGTKGAGAGATSAAPPPTYSAPRGPTATIPNSSGAPSNQILLLMNQLHDKPETINGILENMTPTQIYDFVSKMKAFVSQNPEQGRQLLLASPPLAFMTLQAQALLGMINQQTVQKILSVRGQPSQPAPTPVAPTMVPQPVAPVVPMMAPIQPGMVPMMAPGMMPPGMFPGFVPTGMPAPQMMPQPTQFPGLPDLPEQHKQLLQQIFSMTPDNIEKLPPDQRQQVQQLRQTFMPYAQFFAPPM